jgi:heme exporter protein D
MGFWPWFWIWTALSISALALIALVAKSLYNKLESAGHQAKRLLEKTTALASAIEEKPKISAPESSLLADPAIAKARLLVLQKMKIKKQEQRQRRLIASLKRFDPNESRFH